MIKEGETIIMSHSFSIPFVKFSFTKYSPLVIGRSLIIVRG